MAAAAPGGGGRRYSGFQRSVGIVAGLLLLLLLATLAYYAYRETRPTPQASGAGAFRVALVLPGPIDDKSWNASGYEGLLRVHDRLGAQISYQASVDPREAGPVIRRFATEGYDFVIVHGAQFIPATEAVAKDHFRTKFAVTTAYSGNNRNFGGLAFRAGEVGYLTGFVAALKSRTRRIAYIGGVIYPITQEDVTLFRRGAQAVDPRVRVSVDWVGDWSDAPKARRLAQARLKEGADVVVVNCASASEGALKAAEAGGVWAIGWNLDRFETAPGAIVTSAIQRVPVLFAEAALLVEQGRWEGRQYKFGLREGAQALAPFRGRLSPAQERRVAQVTEDILRGKIDVSP